MKQFLLIFFCTLLTGCSNPRIFILDDTQENKYFVSDLIDNIKENQIGKSPLIVINGIPFKYEKSQDTILLPLKKSEIKSLEFLNQNSSRIMYNEKENDGAVIITTQTQD